MHCNVEGDVLRKSSGRRSRNTRKLAHKAIQIERGGKGKVCNADGTAQICAHRRARESEVRVRSFAHALRIEKANPFCRQAQIKLHAWAKQNASFHGHRSAT